jgi:hypothetical protein
MDFEILINDLFVNLATDPKLTPTANKCVLSLVNDFEDKAWRHEKFANFIWDNIALTALSAQERDKLADRSYTKLKASAQNLRLTDKADDIGEGSELAEIVLYGIMHHHYKALPVVPKIFYKQNAQDNAKGADSVHIVLDDKGDFSLWFGEAKFFNSIEDARLPEVVTSVGKSLNTKKLKKENSIITNTSDLDALLKDAELTARIKMALSDQGSIDLIKPKINIPILLLHECAITASATGMTDAYRAQIVAYHRARAEAYFSRQIKALAGKVNLYEQVKFHVILFPVPSRKEVIKEFTSGVRHFKGGK